MKCTCTRPSSSLLLRIIHRPCVPSGAGHVAAAGARNRGCNGGRQQQPPRQRGQRQPGPLLAGGGAEAGGTGVFCKILPAAGILRGLHLMLRVWVVDARCISDLASLLLLAMGVFLCTACGVHACRRLVVTKLHAMLLRLFLHLI